MPISCLAAHRCLMIMPVCSICCVGLHVSLCKPWPWSHGMLACLSKRTCAGAAGGAKPSRALAPSVHTALKGALASLLRCRAPPALPWHPKVTHTLVYACARACVRAGRRQCIIFLGSYLPMAGVCLLSMCLLVNDHPGLFGLSGHSVCLYSVSTLLQTQLALLFHC